MGGSTVLSVMGLLVSSTYILQAGIAGGVKPMKSVQQGRGRKLSMIILLIAVASAFTGVEIIGSVYMARLSREVGTTLYSIANAAAGLIGAVARPLAGMLIDRAGATPVLSTVLVLYALYTVALNYSSGLIMALLWILPFYPVFELSLYKQASLIAGEAMGTATVSSSYSLTGILLFGLGAKGVKGNMLLLVAVAAFIISVPIVLVLSAGEGGLERDGWE